MKKIPTLLFIGAIITIIIFCLSDNNCHVFSQEEYQIDQELFNKYRGQIIFSDDFKAQEKELILQIIDKSSIPDLEIFKPIYFIKTDDKKLQIASSVSGLIQVSDEYLKEQSYERIKKIIGHELGHLLDFHTFSDQSRAEYAKLRDFKITPELIGGWLQDYSPHHTKGIDPQKWAQEPTEDLAEVFNYIYFDEKESIVFENRPVTDEVKDFFINHFANIEKYKQKSQASNLSINAQIMLEELSADAINPAKLLQLPNGYGNLIYLFPKKNANQEYVFVSYKLGDSSKQIHYYYSPKGYDNYESYFQKAADEIVYYDGVNYYILKNQGKNKDYILASNGEMVLMANDESIDKYDLMLMMGEARDFEN